MRTKELIIANHGWDLLSTEVTQSTYKNLMAYLPFEKSFVKTGTIQLKKNVTSSTQAEAFGSYVRELYQVYQVILESMKSSGKWIALQTHSTEHSEVAWSNSAVIDEDCIQVRGFHFDPAIFPFPWEDNTLAQPWKPWGWQVSPFSDDPDDTNYFFDKENRRLIVGKIPVAGDSGTIDLYHLTPRFPAGLSLFEFRTS